MPLLHDRVHARLEPLSHRLGSAEWIDGTFTAGDLMLIGVWFRSKELGVLAPFPNLLAYVSRGEARPAYQRAFAAQLAVFSG